MYACSGILFNHESYQRRNFRYKKIIQGLVKIKNGRQKKLFFLGNLYAKRDWGHARDYVEAMWKMLQQRKTE